MFSVLVPGRRMRIRSNIGHQARRPFRLQAICHALNQNHAGCRTLETSESQPSSVRRKSGGSILESGIAAPESSSYGAGFKGEERQAAVARRLALRKDQPFSVWTPGQHPLWDWSRPSNQMNGVKRSLRSSESRNQHNIDY